MISATYPIHFVTATANETQQGTTVSSRGFFFFVGGRRASNELVLSFLPLKTFGATVSELEQF